MYSSRQISEIKLKIINKISREVDRANLDGAVGGILEKYNIVYEEFVNVPSMTYVFENEISLASVMIPDVPSIVTDSGVISTSFS